MRLLSGKIRRDYSLELSPIYHHPYTARRCFEVFTRVQALK